MCNAKKEGLTRLIYEFEHPAEEFSPLPFWFWNDTLTEEELSRQIYAFKEKGVDGFIIHPRLGLDPEIEYMGEKWLHFVRFAVELAKKLNMKVMLYDEAMYPSGSCGGQVVEEDPDFAAKGLKMCESPEIGEGEKLIAQTEYEGESRWFIQTPTRGVIRGAYYGRDDCDADAPLAADLLNPKAVAAFIRLTHQKYYDALAEYFGDTVIAVFTDEPTLTGRNPVEGIIPWTDDFLDDFKAKGYSESDLPALFDGAAENAAQIKADYDDILFERMNRDYYRQIAAWCEEHGVVLTGHPESSSDIRLLSHFGIPCQDIVWRYLYPGEPTNLRGVHSTMGKCASDSARHLGRRRNGNECFGVCGHRDDPYAFERADMKWYIDWLFARGCNLIIPHAFYYSLRDKRREERPPEVGMNSVFWEEYKEISDYIKRCCAINTDSTNVTDVAVLCLERFLPDEPVKILYENQVEFNYLERALTDSVTIENGTAKIADQQYRVIITERDYDPKTEAFLGAFKASGGTVIDRRSYSDESEYLAAVCAASKTVPDITSCEHLRMTHLRKYGVDVLFLSNEGEEELTTVIREKVAEIWDSEKGTRTSHSGEPLSLTLAPRKSLHLILE
ncbi:MAG: hypothetical protein IJO96_01395 [Oscillospiraceae bacterium]|nr:hypothetical protein [Oscillospiraceae bacterium]